MLTSTQIDQLLKPIHPSRVMVLDGMSHLAAYDVRAHLSRIFGFAGWSSEVTDLTLIHDLATQTRAGKDARKVAYRATVRLEILATGAVYTEAAVGESTMPDFKHGDAHDMAIKTAESQALKRCAVNLGDQFGLGLYVKGHDPRDPAAVVLGTLSHPPQQTDSLAKPDLEDGVAVEHDPDVATGYTEEA
jgi:recombination DNA repair RAD52 pathway protein